MDGMSMPQIRERLCREKLDALSSLLCGKQRENPLEFDV